MDVISDLSRTEGDLKKAHSTASRGYAKREAGARPKCGAKKAPGSD